jgi:hypothetical protein
MPPKKKKIEEEAPKDFGDFAVWFIKKNGGVINNYIRRRLIPNRYSPDDIKSYMQERILDVLQKRLAKGNPIEEPKIYFRRLIDFWCVEYQRMYGFVYALPKRPRDQAAEEDIGQYGFHYFMADTGDGNYGLDRIPQLGYIDSATTEAVIYENKFRVIGLNPDEFSESWKSLMIMALPEDRDVLTCLYRYNLTVPQVSDHLSIAVSTTYQRKERGLRAISGTLASFVDLDQDSWKVLEETTELAESDIDITRFFRD